MKTTRKIKIGIIFASVLCLMAVASARQRSFIKKNYGTRKLSTRIKGVPVRVSITRRKHKLDYWTAKESCTRTLWNYITTSRTVTETETATEQCASNNIGDLAGKNQCLNDIGTPSQSYRDYDYSYVVKSSYWMQQSNATEILPRPCSWKGRDTYKYFSNLRKRINDNASVSRWYEEASDKHIFKKYSKSKTVKLRYVRDKKIYSCILKQRKVVRTFLKSIANVQTIIKRVDIKMIELSYPKKTFDTSAASNNDAIAEMVIKYDREKKVLYLNIFINSKKDCIIVESSLIHDVMEEEE